MALVHKLISLYLVALFVSDLIACYGNLEGDTTIGDLVGGASLCGTASYPSHFMSPFDERFDRVGVSQVSRSNVFNVDYYGAKGDGKTDDTKAFGKAWAHACSSSVSAVLLVPKKKSYLLKQITFSGSCKSSVTLVIKGNIEAPSKLSDWKLGDQRHWILFNGIRNLSVTGGGTINGNGKMWWLHSCKVNKSLPCKDAPTAMTFYSCKNLRVENLSVRNSPQIQVSFEKSTNVKTSNLTITAPSWSPNTDGIHVAHTQNIEITNCVIRTGDDCISIATGSQGVNIMKIICGPGHGISIGSLGARNSKAQVSNVTVDTAQLIGTQNGARIKTWQGGSGYVRAVVFKNIMMDNVENPIIIDQNYCDSSKACKIQKSAVEVSNILYENIKGTSASQFAITFNCSKSIPCHGITMQNINLVGQNKKSTISACDNAMWTKKGNVIPTPCVYN
ncbi:polygalacturonase-like [Ananas comosus]|uniref:endo-polygalacturonase n=1 Tax=Ananas comosus TaxID=4615 RepID=A0A6P5ET09_ANACO|nr:polygalacturonase-like [Ananas comosus]